MTNESNQSPSILVVDDEADVGQLVRSALLSLTEDIVVVESGRQATDACLQRSFDLIISDIKMPGMNGVELLQLLAHDYPSMRRIILTGYADLEQTMDAINSGRVHRFLQKPWLVKSLVDAVSEELMISKRESSEITRLRDAIDKLSDRD